MTAVVRRGIDAVLADSRAGMARLSPAEVVAAQARGALVVDTRTEAQRRRQGELPGAVVIDRTVLEWRLDPACDHRDAELASYDRRVILMCDEGYQSSLAAATLKELGIENATDMIGGFQAWIDAGLPRREP